MKVLIALPVFKRDWTMPTWFKAIEKQTIGLENIGFQFELGRDDEETHNILWDWHSRHPECWLFDPQINERENHATHLEGQRAWKRDEYLRMVGFRNSLLDRAASRSNSFDYYFSLDSDVILENPETIEKLICHKKDVVSPLMFMTPHGEEYPNAMSWATVGDKFAAHRMPMEEGLVKIDVAMAAVMMSKEVAENVRYVWHAQGEDIGFATELYKKGYQSFIDFDIYAPHIMHRYQMDDYLINGDPRSPKL